MVNDAGYVISEEDLASGPRPGLITQELLCSRVLLKWKRDRESFWHRHQKGGGECPHPLVLAVELYTFSIAYYSKSKESLKVVKVLPDPLPQYTF